MMSFKTWLNAAPPLYSWGDRYAQLRHYLRPEQTFYDSHCNDLRASGITIIRDFLPISQFAQLRAEYEAAKAANSHPRVRSWEDCGCRNWAVVFTNGDPAFQATNSFMRNDDQINRAVESVARRPVDYWPPTMSYLHQSRGPGVIRCTDDSAVKHQDVGYPTVKVVLYMFDVTQHDAPFMFWPGGQEYPLSVLGPKNTLIIADHSNFHARGQFSANSHRVTLRISFRYLESPRYRHRRIVQQLLGRS